MRAFQVLRSNIFHMGIIGEVERHTAEVQRENNAILLGDTGTILNTIINQEEAPFIYERLGIRCAISLSTSSRIRRGYNGLISVRL